MDETADIALSARAVGGGGARLPVWITGTLLGPGVGAWPRPRPRPTVAAIDGGRDTGGGASASPCRMPLGTVAAQVREQTGPARKAQALAAMAQLRPPAGCQGQPPLRPHPREQGPRAATPSRDMDQTDSFLVLNIYAHVQARVFHTHST